MTTYIEDDGTMPENVQTLADAVVGHRIVTVERNAPAGQIADLRLILDDGTTVTLFATADCCAYTALDDVIYHLPSIDHVITAVRADDDFETWHLIADLGEVMALKVGWSSGNPFYYGYGFDIRVEKVEVSR